MKLEGGIGLSLINKVPEELVFASLTGINVHYTQLATSHMLELSIQDVQVMEGRLELVKSPCVLTEYPPRSSVWCSKNINALAEISYCGFQKSIL